MLIQLPLIVAAFGISVEGASVVGPELVYSEKDLRDSGQYVSDYGEYEPQREKRDDMEFRLQPKSYQNKPLRVVFNKIARIGKRRADLSARFVPAVGKPPAVFPAPEVCGYDDKCKHEKGKCWCKESSGGTTQCTYPTDCKCPTRVTCGPTQPPIKWDDKWCNPRVCPTRAKPTIFEKCMEATTIPVCTTKAYTPCATFTPPCVHPTPVTQETCICLGMTCPPTTKCCIAEEELDEMNAKKLKAEDSTDSKIIEGTAIELKMEISKNKEEGNKESEAKLKESKGSEAAAPEAGSNAGESKDSHSMEDTTSKVHHEKSKEHPDSKPVKGHHSDSKKSMLSPAKKGKTKISENEEDESADEAAEANDQGGPLEMHQSGEAPEEAGAPETVNIKTIEDQLARLVRSPLCQAPKIYTVST